MKWAGLLLSVFLLLLFCVSLSADEMADITKSELKTLLMERESFKEQLKTQDEDFLKTLDQLEIEHQNDLTALEMKYDQKIALLMIQSEVRTASLNDLKSATTWNNVKWFIAGLGLGFGTGNYTGFKIGVTIR